MFLLLEAQAAASTKPIAVKPGSRRAATHDVGPTRKSSAYGKPAPGFYAAPLHHANSYAPYPVPGAAGTSRYSPYGSYYSTGGFANAPSYSTGSFPPSRAGFASTQAQPRYPHPQQNAPTTASYSAGGQYLPPATTQAANDLMSLTAQSREAYSFPDNGQCSSLQFPPNLCGRALPRSFGSPGGHSDAPSSDASSLDLGDSPRTEPKEAPGETHSFGAFLPGAANNNYPGQSSQRSGLTASRSLPPVYTDLGGWKSQSRAGGGGGWGGYDSVPSLTGRPTISLPSLASIGSGGSSFSESSLRGSDPQQQQQQPCTVSPVEYHHQQQQQGSPVEYSSSSYRAATYPPPVPHLHPSHAYPTPSTESPSSGCSTTSSSKSAFYHLVEPSASLSVVGATEAPGVYEEDRDTRYPASHRKPCRPLLAF